jgi:hypothetical protein
MGRNFFRGGIRGFFVLVCTPVRDFSAETERYIQLCCGRPDLLFGGLGCGVGMALFCWFDVEEVFKIQMGMGY